MLLSAIFRSNAADVERLAMAAWVVKILIGHVGPRTDEKWRIRGMRLGDARVSIKAATFFEDRELLPVELWYICEAEEIFESRAEKRTNSVMMEATIRRMTRRIFATFGFPPNALAIDFSGIRRQQKTFQLQIQVSIKADIPSLSVVCAEDVYNSTTFEPRGYAMSFRGTKAGGEPHSFAGPMQAYVILLWGKLSGYIQALPQA